MSSEAAEQESYSIISASLQISGYRRTYNLAYKHSVPANIIMVVQKVLNLTEGQHSSLTIRFLPLGEQGVPLFPLRFA